VVFLFLVAAGPALEPLGDLLFVGGSRLGGSRGDGLGRLAAEPGRDLLFLFTGFFDRLGLRFRRRRPGQPVEAVLFLLVTGSAGGLVARGTAQPVGQLFFLVVELGNSPAPGWLGGGLLFLFILELEGE